MDGPPPRGRRSAGPGPVPDQPGAVRGTRLDHPRAAGGPAGRGTAVRGVVRRPGRDRGGGTAMIGKVPDGPDKRGERCEGLIYYLYSPGRREEHTDPHIVAGWRHPAELE